MSLSAYKSWLILHSKSKRTITNRLKALIFLSKHIIQWDKECVDQFLIAQKEKGCRNSSINAYISCIRTYAQCMGFGEELTQYRFLKVEPTNKACFTDDEIERFLALKRPHRCLPETWNSTNLFFSLMAYTGCRPHEIATLRSSQVLSNALVLTDTKTHKPRNVPIPELIRDDLFKHLEGKDYLFITQRGAVYSDHFWIPAFNKRLKMLGIHRKGLTCYSFRHSMATSLLRQDVNVHKIAKLLGNSVNAITESYEHLVIEDVEKALNKHPLIRKHLKPSESEILTELENVLKAYDLRYNIKQKQGRINVEVIFKV